MSRDSVNHPKHYTFGKFEVLAVIEDWNLSFHEGNVLKYIARAPHKGNQLEDLRKARFYLDRKIQLLEEELAGEEEESIEYYEWIGGVPRVVSRRL